MVEHAWWPFMHRDLLSKTAEFNPSVKIGKNLNYMIPSSKWAPFKLRKEPNEENQLDFGGSIYNEKNQEVCFFSCIVCLSKFPTTEALDRANAQNNLKFL